MTAVVVLHLVSVIAAANNPHALFCSLCKRKGAARPKRRQGFPVILVLDRKPVFIGGWRNWQTHPTVSRAVKKRKAHLVGSNPTPPAYLLCGCR